MGILARLRLPNLARMPPKHTKNVPLIKTNKNKTFSVIMSVHFMLRGIHDGETAFFL